MLSLHLKISFFGVRILYQEKPPHLFRKKLQSRRTAPLTTMVQYMMLCIWLMILLVLANSESVEIKARGQSLWQSKPGRMPVIGILTMPMTSADGQMLEDISFIDTSYVKFIHGGGATVVPILFNSTAEQIQEQILQLDGVFFTGGAAKPTTYPIWYKTAQLLYSLVMEQGKTLWGTCLGFQTITDIAADQPEGVLGDYPAMNVALSLNFTEYGANESQMFSHLPAPVRNLFSEKALTENWHNYGVSLPVFRQYLQPKGFRIVSTNIDSNGVEFVSTLEHETAHIFATQWHPEANQYDPDPKGGAHIVHSMEATTAMNYLANFLAQSARSSMRTDIPRKPKTETHNLQGHQSDLKMAIENYPVRAVVSEDDTAFQYIFE